MDDLISQNALLDIVGEMPLCWEYGQGVSDVYDIIKSMPTLTLDDLRQKGRWVKKPWKACGCILRYDTVCSECGFDAPEFTDGGCCTVLTKFCHNCGADMRGGGEDE